MRIRDGRRIAYFMVDNAIVDRYAKEIGPNALAIYYSLCRHASAEGEAWPALRVLCDGTGLSRATVSREIGNLERVGLVAVSHQLKGNDGQTSNLYTLLPVNPDGPPPGWRDLPPPVRPVEMVPIWERNTLPTPSHAETPPSQPETPPVSHGDPPHLNLRRVNKEEKDLLNTPIEEGGSLDENEKWVEAWKRLQPILRDPETYHPDRLPTAAELDLLRTRPVAKKLVRDYERQMKPK